MGDESGREMTHAERVADAKTRVREVGAREQVARRAGGEDAVYLDVREPNEWNLFHIPGAVHVPLGTIDESIGARVPPDKHVVVYCGGGGRSALAADQLQRMGYGDVVSLAGGIRDWMAAGGELADE